MMTNIQMKKENESAATQEELFRLIFERQARWGVPFAIESISRKE